MRAASVATAAGRHKPTRGPRGYLSASFTSRGFFGVGMAAPSPIHTLTHDHTVAYRADRCDSVPIDSEDYRVEQVWEPPDTTYNTTSGLAEGTDWVTKSGVCSLETCRSLARAALARLPKPVTPPSPPGGGRSG